MVCSIVSIGLQSKKNTNNCSYCKKKSRHIIIFFLWQRACPKNVDFCLNTPNRQNWYFAHCHVHLWPAVSQYRFSAFWLRSKCSICSYQLNIWYENHVFSSILNWFLKGDGGQELAPTPSRVGLTLQYRQDRPTSPLYLSSLAQMFQISPDCLTAVSFYSCLAGRTLSVSLRWRHSSDIARQMAGWGRDRAGGDFCFSVCLRLANNPSPGLGTQNSWTPAGEGKTEALTEQFDKYWGLGLVMEPRLSIGLGGIWRDQQIV